MPQFKVEIEDNKVYLDGHECPEHLSEIILAGIKAKQDLGADMEKAPFFSLANLQHRFRWHSKPPEDHWLYYIRQENKVSFILLIMIAAFLMATAIFLAGLVKDQGANWPAIGNSNYITTHTF